MLAFLIGLLQIFGYTGSKGNFFNTMQWTGNVDFWSCSILVFLAISIVYHFIAMFQMKWLYFSTLDSDTQAVFASLISLSIVFMNSFIFKNVVFMIYSSLDSFIIQLCLINIIYLYVTSIVSIQSTIRVSLRFRHVAAMIINLLFTIVTCLLVYKVHFSNETIQLYSRYTINPQEYQVARVVLTQFLISCNGCLYANDVVFGFTSILMIILLVYSYKNHDKSPQKIGYTYTWLMMVFYFYFGIVSNKYENQIQQLKIMKLLDEVSETQLQKEVFGNPIYLIIFIIIQLSFIGIIFVAYRCFKKEYAIKTSFTSASYMNLLKSVLKMIRQKNGIPSSLNYSFERINKAINLGYIDSHKVRKAIIMSRVDKELKDKINSLIIYK